MNANATPDSPVHDAAAPRTAANDPALETEEPAWIEIGSPKRWNTPPAWSDEITRDAWDRADLAGDDGASGEGGSSETTSSSFELVDVPDSADTAPQDTDAALSGRDSPGEPDEDLEDAGAPEPSQAPAPVTSSTSSSASAGTADAWMQGPVVAAEEPAGTTEPLDLPEAPAAEATEQPDVYDEPTAAAAEQIHLRHESTAAQEIPAGPEPTGIDDPESGDRWQVVADDERVEPIDQEPASPLDREDAESADPEDATAVPAAAVPAAALPTAADLAAATSSAGPSRPHRPPAPRATGTTADAEFPALETDRPARETARATQDPAKESDHPADETAGAAEGPATESERPAADTVQEDARPGSATLGGALDLLGPHLQARRPALILGLVALVLSIWALVALPFPLKYAIDAALAVAGAPTTSPDGIGPEPTVALWSAAGALAGLVAVQAGLRALSVAILNRAGGRIATDLRGRLLSHLQHLSPGRDIDDLGRTASPLVEGVARLRDLVAHTGPRILGGLLALASLLVVVLVVEPIAAAIVLVTAGLFALVASGSLRRQRRLETAATADEAVLADTAEELLAATATIQSYGLEQRAESSLGDLGTRAAHSRSAARRARAVGRFLTQLIAGLGVGAALLVGGWRMNSGTMTPGELTMVIAYVLLAVVLVREVVQHAVALPTTRTAAGRVGALLEHRAAITDPLRSQRIDRLRGEVVYSALSAEGPHSALFDRISLVIPAGQNVALVGREGLEASALLSYLLRFEEPDTGRVLLDRFDTRVLALADLRGQLAVVQRESALFTETVRENIRVGRPEASDDEIVEAARRSGADEFITLLPEGYDTLLTRRGAGLSDGQRRRIAITRALLRDAPVVVLDGADEELAPTERAEVRRALEVLTEGRTALISSRETETVLAADRVVCFESGDLAEDGAPAQLAEDPDSWLASWLHAADVDIR